MGDQTGCGEVKIILTQSVTLILKILFCMNGQLITLIGKLKDNSILFKDVIEFIESQYQHQPTAFKNGDAYNEATQNQGSAKVFAFAQINSLSKEDTLYLFAEHYQSVLNNPNGNDHQNIRQFMAHGWSGVVFEGQALVQNEKNNQ
ncbi:HopJ type III effector protein [Chitinophaga sp. HK235]|uniref:HopJ type III effector protein n=1 Tax=Chitinophaga sp. HK235 TaxID=2952571 RepID=UPI0020137BB5|nr:HopJ type III effector protein [Chitinophaga sp. HK235]